MVRARCFHWWGLGSIPGWGTEISQVTPHGQGKGWGEQKPGINLTVQSDHPEVSLHYTFEEAIAADSGLCCGRWFQS